MFFQYSEYILVNSLEKVLITLKGNPSQTCEVFYGRTSGETLQDFSGGNSSETLVIFPVLTLVKFLKKLLSRQITDEIIRTNTLFLKGLLVESLWEIVVKSHRKFVM